VCTCFFSRIFFSLPEETECVVDKMNDKSSVVMKTLLVSLLLLLTLGVSISDGSDRQKHHHNHHHRKHHHHRQRRHGVDTTEWSPSQALIHEKRKDGSVKSEVTFGSGMIDQSLEDWVFLTKNATTVRAHIGSTAILPCDVKKDSQFGMITWSRLEDEFRPYSLLTIGDQNYVEDKRFFVARPPRGPNNLAWALRIQRVTPDDAGRYECQATTHPPQSVVTRLKVVEAFAQILGTKEKIIKSGSKLQLHCILKKATEEPLYVFWYHNDRMINYDSDRGVTVTKDTSGSTLSLTLAQTDDSGNYTCSPYNIRPASVLVHVLSEGNSAAAVQNEQDQNVNKQLKPTADHSAPPSAAVQSSGTVSLDAAPSKIVFLLLLIYNCRIW